MKTKYIAKYIYSLERKIKKLEQDNVTLKKNLAGKGLMKGVILPESKLRDKIIKYKLANPKATIRAIQKACKVSSPSVVDYHLKRAREFELLQDV